MRIAVKSLLLMFIITILAAAEVFYVRPTSRIGIYKNRIRQVNEDPIEKVDDDDKLLVKKTEGRYYFVEFDGQSGWVEKRNTSKTQGKAYTFDDVTVQGYMDNPTAMQITDQNRDLTSPIDIDKSFEDALKRSVDKETALRNHH